MKRTYNYEFPAPEKNDYAEIGCISEAVNMIDTELKRVENLAGDTDTMDEHIVNEENPHNVTAKQVGAVSCNVAMSMSINESGGLRITYDE